VLALVVVVAELAVLLDVGRVAQELEAALANE